LSLELRGLWKRFGDVVAVRDLTLELAPGELMTLLGPSGCGKTTALRLIAGFETPDAGRITFSGEDVTARSPQKRGFGMVFQSYALFPHLSVFENVAFGLKAQRKEASELGRLVEAALARRCCCWTSRSPTWTHPSVNGPAPSSAAFSRGWGSRRFT
jgi:ABC-type Fe3+/spermidine/putrescine transport system ATPase subunit